MILLLLLIVQSSAFPTGADPSACDTLLPNADLHGASVSPGNGGYSYTPDVTTYSPGSRVSVTITGTSQFLGFLVVALDMNRNRVGSWLQGGNKLLCANNTGLTHQNANPKTSIIATWVAPDKNVGPVNFAGAVVRTQPVYFSQLSAGSITYGAPDSPTDLVPVSGTPTSISLSWVAATTGVQATSFELQRANSTTPNTFETVNIGATTNFDDTTVVEGTTYIYRVRGAANNLNGSFSDLLVVQPPATGSSAPSEPTPQAPDQSTITPTTISITWSPPATLNQAYIYAYVISYVPVAGGTAVTTTVPGTQTTYTATGLTQDTSYNFMVQALSLSGNSNFSLPLTVDTIKGGCLNNCNGNGDCVLNQCQCDDKHLGEDCSMNVSFSHCASGHCVYATIADPNIHLRLSAVADGWVGITFGAGDGMTGGDNYQFNVVNGTSGFVASGQDSHSSSKATPTIDGHQDIDNLRGYLTVNGGKRTVYAEFSRALDTGDNQDSIINPNATITSYAYADFPSFTTQHSFRVRGGTVNFNTGVASLANRKTNEIAFVLIALGVAALFGVLFTYSWGLDPKNGCARCCLRRKIGRVPSGGSPTWCVKFWDYFTMDVRFQLPDLYWCEIGALCLYFFGCLGYLIQGIKNRKDAQLDWNTVFGGLTAIHLALTYILPTRNSIIVHIFGVPFERAIKYHRWAARAVLPFIITHLITMLNARGSDQAFNFDSINTPDGRGIGFGMLAFIFYGTILCFAWEPIRRRLFELFYTVHMLVWGLFILAALHSNFFIYWAIGPMVLYFLDRCIRFVRSRRRAQDLQVEVRGEVTHITFTMPAPFHFAAGDYCFLQIPQVSCDQWHPFSISCPPPAPGHTGPTQMSFHILNMGPRTFTGVLHHLAQGKKAIDAVYCDGPHGRLELPAFTAYPNVVLVAGGVGATPIMSIFGHLLNLHSAGQAGHLKSVHLIWSVKNASAAQTWFPNLLSKAKEDGIFHTHIYCSRGEKKDTASEETGAQINIQTGRPDFRGIFEGFKGEDPDSVAVLVCGPAPMVADVQNLAMDHHFHFHKETFAL